MEHIGFINYSLIAPSTFTYYDFETNEDVTTEFPITTPKDYIKGVAALISANQLSTVVCNRIGYSLCASIENILKNNYSYTNCEFKLKEN